MINVTKAFLPPLEEYERYLAGIWDRCHLTNHGPLVLELEAKLKDYFGVKYFLFLNNGTIALQLAIKALELKGEIITTPFSYVATTSSIVWENAVPVFVDIEPRSFTIDPEKIEAAITEKTSAILATHVYGIPCDVEAIAAIAAKHNLRVVYDAAHAFGVSYRGISLMNFGDISTISFHATKLFHTVEGGGVATNSDELGHKLSYLRNFGHRGQDEFWGLGINGKNSEFHAAMGLCNFRYIESILDGRKKLCNTYETIFSELGLNLKRPQIPDTTKYNYAYFPIVFETESQLIEARLYLNELSIYPRRYFFPSLDKLPYVFNQNNLEVASSVASRVLCLPLYQDLDTEVIRLICETVKRVF